MVAFGVGEVLGSHLIGFIIDYFTSRKATVFIIMLEILMMTFTIKAINTAEYGTITFLMTFFWGLHDASINVQLFQILGFEYENATEPFGLYLLL